MSDLGQILLNLTTTQLTSGNALSSQSAGRRLLQTVRVVPLPCLCTVSVMIILLLSRYAIPYRSTATTSTGPKPPRPPSRAARPSRLAPR